MNKIKANQIVELEQPLIKVPYEQLRKSFRSSQKQLEKKLTSMSESVDKCLTEVKKGNEPTRKATELVDNLIIEVEKLSQNINRQHSTDVHYAKRLKTRVDHLDEIPDPISPRTQEFRAWNRTRLDRVIIDYLLRESFSDTAKTLSKRSGIEDMVDIPLFIEADKVEEALRRHSCKECIQWCSENRSGLKKLKSNLEFNLRLQEHIELARSSRTIEAVKYSKKYLVPWKDTEQKRIMQAMGLLAFKSDTLCQPFKDLYDERRWNELITQFRSDNYSLCSLTSYPLLSITLQAGLSALKTPQCSQECNRNANCPVCDQESMNSLAEKLPLSHHLNSTLVCHVSGKIMNEDNPPMILPNGRVYSLETLQDMAAKNDGMLICPRTGDAFRFEDMKKVYIS